MIEQQTWFVHVKANEWVGEGDKRRIYGYSGNYSITLTATDVDHAIKVAKEWCKVRNLEKPVIEIISRRTKKLVPAGLTGPAKGYTVTWSGRSTGPNVDTTRRTNAVQDFIACDVDSALELGKQQAIKRGHVEVEIHSVSYIGEHFVLPPDEIFTENL